eukprot:scaffold394392_cov32-Prasinocladus_malaysianus.AAC.1
MPAARNTNYVLFIAGVLWPAAQNCSGREALMMHTRTSMIADKLAGDAVEGAQQSSPGGLPAELCPVQRALPAAMAGESPCAVLASSVVTIERSSTGGRCLSALVMRSPVANVMIRRVQSDICTSFICDIWQSFQAAGNFARENTHSSRDHDAHQARIL